MTLFDGGLGGLGGLGGKKKTCSASEEIVSQKAKRVFFLMYFEWE